MCPTKLIPKSLQNAYLYQMPIKHYKFLDNSVVRSNISSKKLFPSIFNAKTREVHFVMMKIANHQAFRRRLAPIRAAFVNETHFYANVCPALQPYLRDDVAPSMLACSPVEGEEGLVLENLKKDGYRSLGKEQRLRKDQLTLLMRAYGKLHGSSFALKEKDEGMFRKLDSGYTSILPLGYHRADYTIFNTLEDTFQAFAKYFDESAEDHIRKKFMIKYAENPDEILASLSKKFKSYSCVLHGNARSSNFMFKYNKEGQPTSVRLVDFAHSRIGSPVLDLSCCIYSNSSKTEFKKLYDYLKIYHDTLSNTLEKHGCNSELIFPYHILREQWKMYAKFGLWIVLGIMRHRAMKNYVKKKSHPRTKTVKYVPASSQEFFKRRFKDLVYHLEEIDAL